MMWIAVVGACLAATVSVVATARAYVQLEAPPAGDWVVATLARSELCRKLDPAAVERIAASTFVQRFGPGETIFSQGSSSSGPSTGTRSSSAVAHPRSSSASSPCSTASPAPRRRSPPGRRA